MERKYCELTKISHFPSGYIFFCPTLYTDLLCNFAELINLRYWISVKRVFYMAPYKANPRTSQCSWSFNYILGSF